MDLFDAVKACVRRWYVIVPLLLISALAVTYVYRDVRTQYSASMSVGVAAPSVTAEADPATTGVNRTNALLSSGGTTLIANLLRIALQQPDVAAKVVAAGGTTTYTASVLTSNNIAQLPIVSIAATGRTSQVVERTIAALQPQAVAALAAIQANAGVPTDLNAKLYPVQNPTAPIAQHPGQVRSAAAIAVAALLLSLVITVLVDSLILRRRPLAVRNSHAVAVTG